MDDADTDIRPLDETTVERIAAGEVVERPASVVKELVENSLDADASRVDVAVSAGGTEGVRVADDGVGMSEADVRMAVRQHTTSKIRDADDLDAGVGTLGFRGEALHTVGAVSRTTITTKPRGDDAAAATELRLEGGEVVAVEPAARPPGTTVEVTDLFYNTPARRNYLKAERTEFAHVSRIVTRYALANPTVAVSLSHDGAETFATTGQGDLRGSLLSVYGREVAESMIAVPADGAPADDAAATVRGFVSHPETTRSTREYLSTYVNGRYVSEPALREAVLSAYGGQLAADRFPFAVLFVEVPPGEVDVNVHPRKMEVRFGDEAGVREAVETAVREALLSAGLVRSSAPRGRSAPDEATVDPGDGGDGDGGGDGDDQASPGGSAAAGASAPSAGGVRDGESESAGDGGVRPAGGSDAGAGDGATTDAGSDGGESVDATASAEPSTDATRTDGTDGPDAGSRPPAAGTDDGPVPGSDDDPTPAPDGPSRKFRPATTNARLPQDGDSAEEATGADGTGGTDARRQFDRLPPLRVLGQVRETYVVAESPDGLVLVDQHAADERVNYERLAARLADEGTASQQLVEPVDLELTAREAAALADCLDDLRAFGFAADLADDGRTARVSAVPAALGDVLDPELLRDALAEFVAGGVDGGRVVDSAADALLADLACYPSVTGGTSLTEGSVVDLLAALDDCGNPWACPHGRPTVLELTDGELADRFERDYPGHATRRPEE